MTKTHRERLEILSKTQDRRDYRVMRYEQGRAVSMVKGTIKSVFLIGREKDFGSIY